MTWCRRHGWGRGRRSAGLALGAAMLALGAGCSVRAPEPGLPAQAPPEAPAQPTDEARRAEALIETGDLAGLEQMLAAAEQRIGRELAGRPGEEEQGRWASAPPEPAGAGTPGVSSTAPAPTATSPVPAAPPSGYGAPDGPPVQKAAGSGEASGPCAAACRALGSMQRAAQGICRITGETAERCLQASDRVAGAQERLRRAGCGCSPG